MLSDILLVVGTFILGVIVTLADVAMRIIVTSNELGEYRERNSHGI